MYNILLFITFFTVQNIHSYKYEFNIEDISTKDKWNNHIKIDMNFYVCKNSMFFDECEKEFNISTCSKFRYSTSILNNADFEFKIYDQIFKINTISQSIPIVYNMRCMLFSYYDDIRNLFPYKRSIKMYIHFNLLSIQIFVLGYIKYDFNYIKFTENNTSTTDNITSTTENITSTTENNTPTTKNNNPITDNITPATNNNIPIECKNDSNKLLILIKLLI